MALDALAACERIEGLTASGAEERVGNFGETCADPIKIKSGHSGFDKKLREGLTTFKT